MYTDIDLFHTGSISRQPLLDYVFRSKQPAGPFTSIKELNDWFSLLPQAHLPTELKYKCPHRSFLPDTGMIKMTHADLHRENIIISSTKPSRVLVIVDWEQAGWYPDYWEYCKALYTCNYESEWREEWIDKFVDPRMDEFLSFIEYTMAIGAV